MSRSRETTEIDPPGSPPETVPEQPDAFDRVGREVASVLRATHEASERLRAEAEEDAAAIRAKAETDASELTSRKVAEAEQWAERVKLEATSVADQARADALSWAEEVKASQELSARVLADTLEMLDAAEAELNRLETQTASSRAELASVRESLASGVEQARSGQQSSSPISESPGEGDEPVIDLRPADNGSTSHEVPSSHAGHPTDDQSAPPTEAHGDEVPTDFPPDEANGIAAAVKSAVSRAVDSLDAGTGERTSF